MISRSPSPVSARAPASSLPFVTVAMPCLNEEHHIRGCLRSVLAQDYPADRLEILVADGGSVDATRAIVGDMANEDPRIELIENPARVQAAGMNAIVRRCRGDVVVRMDVHCVYASDYVRRCVEVLERTGADNVGGAQRPVATTRFQRALCRALESPLGVGGAKYRNAANEGFVDTVFLGAFRRSVFETVGLYDPGAVTNEDAELNQRILAAGGQVYQSRHIVVSYAPRDSLAKLAHQYFRYGRGRARTALKHGKVLTLRPLIPFLLVSSGFVLATTSALHPFTVPAVAAYGALTGVEAVRLAWRDGPAQVLQIWAIFPVLHVSHGCGFASGLARYLLRPDWDEPERIPRRRDRFAESARSSA